MAQVTIELNNSQEFKVGLHKLKNKFSSKEKAILNIIDKFKVK